MHLFHRSKKGLSLMETILVVVIVGVVAGLAVPNMRIGIQNREDVRATETLRSIAHAIRMYQVDHDGNLPGDIAALEAAGYLNSAEYFHKRTSSNTDSNGYQYSITVSPRCAIAEHFIMVTVKGQCHQECHEECDRRNCCDTVCQTVCLPDTTQKQTVGTPLQICE